jgi:hypothetical protein
VHQQSSECLRVLLKYNATFAPDDPLLNSDERQWYNEHKSRIERENPISIERKALQKLLEEQQYGRLEELFQNMEIGQISEKILQGTLPLRGWASIVKAVQDSRHNRQILEKSLQEVLLRITRLKSELNSLEQQQLELESQLKQAASDGLCSKFEHLAECESRLIRLFEQKTSSPDWSVDLMSLDDLKLALQLFDVGCVSQLIAQGFDHVDGILSLDYNILAEHFPNMLLEEKFELLYALQMIEANQFDPKAHCEKCGVCSNDNGLELLREYKVTPELCAKVSVRNLKGKYLSFLTAQQVCSDLAAPMTAALSRCLRNIKQAHFANM